MSELEIQKRQEYKRNRKKWIIIQIVAIVLLLATALGSFLGYRRMNRTHYIEYMESGSIDYKVHYLDNSFFDSEWIDKDQTYISSLTNGVTADFLYRLKADSSDMGFDYTYKIDAKLLIADKQTGTPYYVIEENVVPTKSGSTTAGRAVQVSESVSIDYERFDEIANSFVDMYALKNASCTLIVTLSVDALTTNDRFDKTTSNHYSTALNIPVAVDTFAIYRTSSAVDNEVKVLEYKNAAGRNALLIVGITTLVLSALLSIALLAFITLTRNEDITYSAKVRRILKTYGSYIQRMDGEFDSTDY